MQNPESGWYLMICGADRSTKSCIAVSHALRLMQRQLEKEGFDYEFVDALPGEKDGYVVVFIHVTDDRTFPRDVPTIEVEGVSITVFVATNWDCFSHKDFEFEVFRSKNGIPTAVKTIHKPTGLTVTCGHQYSEQRNRVLGLALLRARIARSMRGTKQLTLYPGETLHKSKPEGERDRHYCPYCPHCRKLRKAK